MATSDLSASTDLVNWTQAVLGATAIQEFAFGRGLIIGTPWWGSGFVASSDGVIWEYVSAPEGYRWFTSIEFANGRFAAFAPSASDGSTPAAVAVSPYGYDWTNAVFSDFTNYTRLCSGNDRFFLVSSSTNAFYSSTDALSWQAHSFGTNAVITDVAFGANTYVAVGSAILQSGPVSNPAPVAATLSICSVPGIRIYGPAGQAYQIEYTDNLSDTNSFVPLTNVVSTTSPFFWADTSYTNVAPRFYRALTRPPGS
jgi:hypothetical protein